MVEKIGAVTAPHSGLKPSPHMIFALKSVYLAVLAVLFYEFSNIPGATPIFAVALSLLYFMPCTSAVMLSFLTAGFGFHFFIKLVRSLQGDYIFEPLQFPILAYVVTLSAIASLALPLLLKGILRLLKRDVLGKNYNLRLFKRDAIFAAGMYAFVLAFLFASVRMDEDGEISALYEQTADLPLQELSIRALDQTISKEQRIAAVLIVSGIRFGVDQIDERRQVVRDFEFTLDETDKVGARTVEYALDVLTEADVRPELARHPFTLRSATHKSIFFSVFRYCIEGDPWEESVDSRAREDHAGSKFGLRRDASAIPC